MNESELRNMMLGLKDYTYWDQKDLSGILQETTDDLVKDLMDNWEENSKKWGDDDESIHNNYKDNYNKKDAEFEKTVKSKRQRIEEIIEAGLNLSKDSSEKEYLILIAKELGIDTSVM